MIRPAILIVSCLLASAAAAKSKTKTLPGAAEPTRPTGCEWAGPGFAKLEGSATCVRVGGSVRTDLSTTSNPGGAYIPWK